MFEFLLECAVEVVGEFVAELGLGSLAKLFGDSTQDQAPTARNIPA